MAFGDTNIGGEGELTRFGSGQDYTADLSGMINLVIDYLFPIGLSLALIMIIVAGIRFIMASGDQNEFDEAKNTLVNAIIGAVIIVGFLAIVNIVLNVLGSNESINQILSS